MLRGRHLRGRRVAGVLAARLPARAASASGDATQGGLLELALGWLSLAHVVVGLLLAFVLGGRGPRAPRGPPGRRASSRSDRRSSWRPSWSPPQVPTSWSSRRGRRRRPARGAWEDRRMLRWLTAGESHGPALVAHPRGPARRRRGDQPRTSQAALARRRLGYGRGARMKFEQDEVELLGGVRHGLTLGRPGRDRGSATPSGPSGRR